MCFFIQVCQWKYLDHGILDITNWGWKIENDIIVSEKDRLRTCTRVAFELRALQM